MNRRGVVFAVVALAASLNPASVFAQLYEGQLPNQEEALQVAVAFLHSINIGDFQSAHSLIARQALSVVSPLALRQQLEIVRQQLGDQIGESGFVQAVPSDQLPNTLYRSTYVSLRFRALYRAGAVFQDIQLELERSGRWRVIGFYFSAASY